MLHRKKGKSVSNIPQGKTALMLNVREGLDWLADSQNSQWNYLNV